MGDISEMMMDGTLCHLCGEFIDKGAPEGIPRACDDCKEFGDA